MSVLNGAGLEGRAGRIGKREGKTNEIKGWKHQGHLGEFPGKMTGQGAKDSENRGWVFLKS